PQYYPHYAQIPGQYAFPQSYPTAPFGNAPAIAELDASVPVAELPAPLPTAPPTSTPADQLSEDEKLARHLSQIELAEARARSNSNLSQHQRPVTFHQPSPVAMSSEFPEVLPTGAHSQGPYLAGPYGAQPPIQASQPHLSPDLGHSPPPLFSSPRPISMYGTSSLQFAGSAPPPTDAVDPLGLATYLETQRQVPYPPQWVLPPITSTLYGSFTPGPKSDWLDAIESFTWSTARRNEQARTPTPPKFHFTFKTKGGSFRDPRFSWTMTSSPTTSGKLISKTAERPWTYNIKRDISSNLKKTETLTPSKGHDLICGYFHGLNYDSLKFIGTDGKVYKWVSHIPLNPLRGYLYGATRHALFVSTQRYGVGAQDPLYGQIVADHAFFDGHIDDLDVHNNIICGGCNISPIIGHRWLCRTCVKQHNLCNTCLQLSKSVILGSCTFTLVSRPDETLWIRSKDTDPAMVVATLQVLKDWEMHSLRERKKKDPEAFKRHIEAARENYLGKVVYWRATDLGQTETGKGEEAVGPGAGAGGVKKGRDIPTETGAAGEGSVDGNVVGEGGAKVTAGDGGGTSEGDSVGGGGGG
ncbi:hypothetical protein BCR34DRAFT_451532, partial [Clohesyomyces aquaticus]